jgi:hypothetical protein
VASSKEQKHWLFDYLRDHPAILVSSIYVTASIVGLVFSWAFLHPFGINFFNFAQISDFLLASLKEPFTWAYVTLALLMVLGDNAMSRRWGRRERAKWLRWYGTATYRRMNVYALILIVAVLISAHAWMKAARIQRGGGEPVTVHFADGGEPVEAVLLGTTGLFVFLYDVEGGRANVHPHESIHAISVKTSRPD